MKKSKTIIYRGSVSFENHPSNFLSESISKLRSWFDGEVIVSTWKHQEHELKGIDGIDKAVLSEDPGSGPVQQINRQVKSYESGLDSASGDLVMVTRCDFIHKTDVFKFVEDKSFYKKDFKILNKKLVIGNMMSIMPNSHQKPNMFRLGDWIQIGSREDVENWGRISEQLEKMDLSNSNCTERIWMIAFLLKNGYENISASDTSCIDKDFWDIVLSNFVIKNTRSTLGSFNMNWDFLPEHSDCYISEEFYNKKYKSVFYV